MPSLLAIFFGALADGTCAPHDSEDNVCLLALNSSRSRLEANSTGTAAVSGDLFNMTDLSLKNSQRGLGATLGTLVSDYRVRSARSASNRSSGAGSATAVGAGANARTSGALVQNSGTDSNNAGGDATRGEANHSETADAAAAGAETDAAETDPAPITLQPRLAPKFQERVHASSGSAFENNLNAAAKTSPKLKFSKSEFIPAPKPPGKDEMKYGKDVTPTGNKVADELDDQYRESISNSIKSGIATTSMTKSAELQDVLQSMYDLGRLIKRMPDDKLESRRETPAPTPPPYAFARRFEPFGKGTSTI